MPANCIQYRFRETSRLLVVRPINQPIEVVEVCLIRLQSYPVRGLALHHRPLIRTELKLPDQPHGVCWDRLTWSSGHLSPIPEEPVTVKSYCPRQRQVDPQARFGKRLTIRRS